MIFGGWVEPNESVGRRFEENGAVGVKREIQNSWALALSSSFCRAEWGKSSVRKQRQPWRHYQTTNHEWFWRRESAVDTTIV
jgi:hypothetical protein